MGTISWTMYFHRGHTTHLTLEYVQEIYLPIHKSMNLCSLILFVHILRPYTCNPLSNVPQGEYGVLCRGSMAASRRGNPGADDLLCLVWMPMKLGYH